MDHVTPHPHGFTDEEPVFSTCAGVDILDVIQRAAKDAAISRVVGDTRAEV